MSMPAHEANTLKSRHWYRRRAEDRPSSDSLRHGPSSFRAEVSTGMYPVLHGAGETESRNLLPQWKLLTHCGMAPVISSGGKHRYESHSFMEPVKGSREISLKNAAFRQAVRHRVSFRHLPSYTPAPLRGPLPLKGAQGVTGLAFVSPVLSPSFRAEVQAGMNHIVSWSR